MLVRSRRAVALAIGAALLALTAACTNPTAPAANSGTRGMSGDGTTVGSSGHAPTVSTDDGTTVGSSG